MVIYIFAERETTTRCLRYLRSTKASAQRRLVKGDVLIDALEKDSVALDKYTIMTRRQGK